VGLASLSVQMADGVRVDNLAAIDVQATDQLAEIIRIRQGFHVGHLAGEGQRLLVTEDHISALVGGGAVRHGRQVVVHVHREAIHLLCRVF